MQALTYGDAAKHLNIVLPDEIVAEAEIPVLTGLQVQGDLIIIPTELTLDPGEIVTKEIPIVRGENGGNTHALVPHVGDVRWRFLDNGTTDIGVLTVSDGAVAYLMHPEHFGNGFGTRQYIVRRQWEKADEMRVVAD